MKHASLFSGIGAAELAAEWMNWENVFHCERDEFCQKILKYYWPGAITYGDIKLTDFTIHRGKIDVLTGGVPCQPASSAGKRKGTEDDRWLWEEYFRAVREIQPRYAVAENVRGLLSLGGGLVFDSLLSKMEAEGYEVLPFLLPACALNAPHRRDRIWIVAHLTSERRGEAGECISGSKKRNRWDGNEQPAADSTIVGHEQSGSSRKWRTGLAYSSINDITTNPGYTEPQGRNLTTEGQQPGGWRATRDQSASLGGARDVTNTSRSGRIQNNQRQRAEQPEQNIPNWRYFPTQSPICSGNDGLPPELVGITAPKHRRESIKAYGNSMVPQIIYEIFKAIASMEALTK